MTSGLASQILYKSLFGTNGDDVFDEGTLGIWPTLNMLGGNDYYSNIKDGIVYAPAAVLRAGDGNDVVNIVGDAPSIVLDGNGEDYVRLDHGSIFAALDGQNDFLSNLLGRISYEGATEGLTARGGFVTSVQAGVDEVYAREFIAGSGDDVIEGFARISGGKGNDILAPMERAEGGAGDDSLIASNPFARVELRGGAGDDSFYFWTDATVSGGAGTDRFVFQAVTQATINDLGANDRIDVSHILDMSITDAVENGYLQLSTSKGYTYGYIDIDGGADNLVELFAVKGVYANIADYLI